MSSHRLLAFGLLFFAVLSISARTAPAQTYTVARGLAYEKAQDWQGLLRYATAWSQAQPNSIDAWGLMGSAYSLGLHEPDKAIAPLRRCVAIDPNSAPAWHALGTAYAQTKQLRLAVDAFKRAIQINPNQPTYYNNLAAAYSEGNAVKSAMAALDQEKVIAERLNSANVWYTLGNGYAQSDRLAKCHRLVSAPAGDQARFCAGVDEPGRGAPIQWRHCGSTLGLPPR